MDGITLALKGLTSPQFVEKWALWEGYQTKIEDPENPGEMIDNPQSAADFIKNAWFVRGQLAAGNQVRKEMDAMVDTAVHDLVDPVEIDTDV